jgi:aldose 1-epimerase
LSVLQGEPFGSVGGRAVERYTLGSTDGLRVRVLTYGGIVQSIEAPDREGRMANLGLGFGTLDEYVASSPYFGALIGRFANRIANGRFSLDGVDYRLPINNGPNSLHGGTDGFDRQVWRAAPLADNILRLALHSPNGDQGYPGALSVQVTYTLQGNALRLDYDATTDAPTVVNFTNHSYFNLAGEGSGSIEQHVLRLHAGSFTPIDANLIPTGSVEPVDGTPFDFRRPRPIGARLRESSDQLTYAQGYDHNFVLDSQAATSPRPAARVVEPVSGRVLEVETTEPGVQFYTANFLDASLRGPSGRAYRQTDAFTLETQHFPDSPNQPQFPSTVLRPGQRFSSTTIFRFSTE